MVISSNHTEKDVRCLLYKTYKKHLRLYGSFNKLKYEKCNLQYINMCNKN